ncbi:unnamed protein product (macronuclear) [Paramecium tetraurelia]|uniref:Enkurin domain-containing protein n=1 Tax=Paramecium tetraurelia TaxID=5888 RepID=A0CUF0_PARTE|nr:uncharacterized protein GSPATT00010617001 [Paramecium tetraurelia]CAK74417.1 unnamed protein product [Paramecium tetraurelia]|eukprot:XP_001441814.1 hypothetical protein (macronuclear) [Paramecium tetraurelia strain d4-2]
MGTNKLADWIHKGSLLLENNHSNRQKVKPQVPKSAERPLIYEQKKKNYIETNKIYTILSTPRQPQKQTDWLKKETYGKVPQYLSNIKQRIYQSFLQQQEDYANQNNHFKLLSESELHEIRKGLKQRYDLINFEYQKYSHHKKFDNVSLRRKQEQYERELDQLEKDMEKVNKSQVYVIK